MYTLHAKAGNKVNLDNYGKKPLELATNNTTIKLTNINNGFKIEPDDDDNSSKDMFAKIQKLNVIDANGICKIAQNSDGVDIEDRIEKGIVLISEILKIS